MPDIASVGAALGSIKTALDIARLIKDSGTSLEQAEFKLKVAELIEALAEAKIEVSELQVAHAEKDRVIDALRDELKLKRSVVWDSPHYWVEHEGAREGPFCQRCHDSDGKLIRLQGNGSGHWQCLSCKCTILDSTYKAPDIVRVARRSSIWNDY